MRVKDLMTRNVETIDMHETAEAAWSLMRARKIHHLVVRSGAEIVGILSARDLQGKDREEFRRSHKVLAVMTPYAVKGRPDMSVRQAANLMRGWTIGSLPVVDGGRLVGIVTVSDLLELIGRQRDRATRGGRAPARRAAGRGKARR